MKFIIKITMNLGAMIALFLVDGEKNLYAESLPADWIVNLSSDADRRFAYLGNATYEVYCFNGGVSIYGLVKPKGGSWPAYIYQTDQGWQSSPNAHCGKGLTSY